MNLDDDFRVSQAFLERRTFSFQVRDSLFCLGFQVWLRPTLFAQYTGKSFFSLFLPLGDLRGIESFLAKEFTYSSALAPTLLESFKNRKLVFRIENPAFGFVVNLRTLYAFM